MMMMVVGGFSFRRSDILHGKPRHGSVRFRVYAEHPTGLTLHLRTGE